MQPKIMLMRRRRQSGFTLVELIIVILIGGLILAGVAAGVSKAMSGQRANAEIAEIQNVSTSIKKIYSNKSSYSGITLTGLINMNAFPPERVSGGAVYNRWGGAVTVVAAGTGNVNFTLTYPSVPTSECLDIIPQLESVVDSVTVAGTSVKASGAALDVSALGTQCNSSATVSIAYTFTK